MPKTMVERKCRQIHRDPLTLHPLKNGTVIGWYPCGCIRYDFNGCEILESGGKKVECATVGPNACRGRMHRRRRHHGADGDVFWCWECGAIKGEDDWVSPSP